VSQREERQRRYIARLRWLSIAIAAVFATVVVRYWYVQVIDGAHYRDLAEKNRLREVRQPAPRGLILDRGGRALVENVPTYRLRLDPTLSGDLDDSVAFASRILEVPASDLAAILAESPPLRPALLAEDLTLSQVARFEAAELEHSEFDVEVGLRRFYRHGTQNAHLLGYIGEASEDAIHARPELRPGDLVGIKGIERSYDPLLRGEDGRRVVVVDSRGRLVKEQIHERATRGADLQLTLDLDLQQAAERFFQSRVGSAVAMDADTGEILALVSAPSYNPNLFARGIASKEWRDLLASPNDPLQNRALQNTYQPGSVFKIVVALAALEEGLVDPDETVVCNGRTRINNEVKRCWRAGGHGPVNLHEALVDSCNIYFYHLGQKLGIERLAKQARRWGLGHPTGIELEGEKSGLVPDREWSLATRGTDWYPGETVSVAIGQGPLLMTSMQAAVMMAAIANGGEIVTPHLVLGEEHEKTSLHVDPENLEVVRHALWAVVNDKGTAGSARVAGLDVAGKTGTAQVIRQKSQIDSEDLPYEFRDHAWFASFATRGEKRLAVVVFVEHGGHGGSAAAPLARTLYETYFGSLPGPSDT